MSGSTAPSNSAGDTDADVLWHEQLTPLLHDDAYTLAAVDLPRATLHATPVQAAADPETFQAYADASADVVMRGGTASGVVYPLALCAIAERFRLRSIGGSSAGAIAAAAAAAAELGRLRQQSSPAVAHPPVPGPAGGFTTGRVRQGFAGLADLTAWLTEMTPDGPAPDDRPQAYRLAALFQPAADARPAYRVAAAVLRQRYWQLLLLLPLAARAWVRATSVAALAAGVLFAAVATQNAQWNWPQAVAGAGYSVLAVVSVTAGFVLLLLSRQAFLVSRAAAAAGTAGAAVAGAPPQTYGRTIRAHRHPGGRSSTSRLFWTGAALLGISVAVGALLAVLIGTPDPRTGWVLLTGAIGGAAFAAVITIVSFLSDFKQRFVDRAATGRYGLISGATPGTARSWLDGVAGLPPATGATAQPALVPWLTTLFDQLAGQGDDEGRRGVLRFGHLWFDRFTPGPVDDLTEYDAASYDAAHRLVNLELMTSEITQGVAYRFPLSHPARNHPPGTVGFADEVRGDIPLYVRADDLGDAGGEVFGRDVIDALCPGRGRAATVVDSPGQPVVQLHRLPEPWDLPVVFAVRLSMSLPFLFQAVPMYRQVGDDADGLRVERVWFSDGGLTSNFPIHLFDQMLPSWPTLGINLTGSPVPDASRAAAGHGAAGAGPAAPREFRLPTVRESAAEPRRLGPSLTAFFAAVFATSRNWRDNMHILLPGFGMRVVAVRLRRGEGDTNIFMARGMTASLALRGARAGTEVRDAYVRSGDSGNTRWQQHQAIRLQTVAMSIATSIRRTHQGSPGVGSLAALDEAAPDGAIEGLARSRTVLDGVDPADVVAVWRAYREAVAALGTRAGGSGEGGPGAGAQRLARTWDRHGVVEERPTPRN